MIAERNKVLFVSCPPMCPDNCSRFNIDNLVSARYISFAESGMESPK